MAAAFIAKMLYLDCAECESSKIQTQVLGKKLSKTLFAVIKISPDKRKEIPSFAHFAPFADFHI